MTSTLHSGVLYALLAAALFGASTPFAKQLGGEVAPVMLAGLLYAGSGAGLACVFLARRIRGKRIAGLSGADIPWLAGAIAAGGVAGPVLLMYGLAQTPASTASLFLNLESVFTALLAWFAFKENVDRRIALGMWCIVGGSVLLSWDGSAASGSPLGVAAIAAACLCWGIDNNLTRKVSASDAVQIACVKGVAAGAVNLAIAAMLGHSLPSPGTAGAAAVVGFAGYGVSLVLFVIALRQLGTARSGAYFSIAPFAGAALSMALLGERPGPLFWAAGALMAAGLWLHLTESHAHEHEHEPLEHTHGHVHDEHHQHDHPDGDAGDAGKAHVHAHVHSPLQHKHPHYPDIHHRHQH